MVGEEPWNYEKQASAFRNSGRSGHFNSETLAFAQALFILWERRIIIANIY